jgi:hypothetical protein
MLHIGTTDRNIDLSRPDLSKKGLTRPAIVRAASNVVTGQPGYWFVVAARSRRNGLCNGFCGHVTHEGGSGKFRLEPGLRFRLPTTKTELA